MIKGIIEYSVEDQAGKTEIAECEMLIAIGLKEVNEKQDTCGYAAQNIILGGIDPLHLSECLAVSIMSQIETMYGDHPRLAFHMMRQFKQIIVRKTEEYMMDHVAELSGAMEELLRNR